jgi:CarD family transcriptional regulator
MTFSVGDKVVHPSYGPGVIKEIERRQIIGEAKRYYVIDMLSQSGTLMTPVSQAEQVGLRPVIGDTSLKRLLKLLAIEPSSLLDGFRERETEVEERLNEGDLFFAAEVVRDLVRYGHDHSLTSRQTQLMQRAEKLLAGELALVKEIEIKEAQDQVRTIVTEAVHAQRDD